MLTGANSISRANRAGLQFFIESNVRLSVTEMLLYLFALHPQGYLGITIFRPLSSDEFLNNSQ